MARCPSCGAQVDTTHNYCRECGTAVAHVGDGRPAQSGGGTPSGQPGRRHRSHAAPSDGDTSVVTRRNLLIGAGAVAGLVGLGGCALGAAVLSRPDHRVHDGWDVERTEGLRSVTLDGTLTLPEGRYAGRNLRPDLALQYDVEFDVSRGGSVDVFTVQEDEYDRYRDRADNFEFVSSLSTTDSSGATLSGTLGAGEYKLVVDNTGVYGADPGGEVEMDIYVSARA